MKKPYLFILLLLWSVDCWSAGKVRLASGEWYPYLSQSLRNGGYVAQIVVEAYELEGYEVELIYLPWARGFQKVSSGDIDGTFVYSKTPSRQKVVLFSDEILSVPIAIFYRSNLNFNWNDVNDLQGLKIGGVLGYDYGVSKFEHDKTIVIDRIENQMGNYRKLLAGRLDILFEFPEVGESFIERLGVQDQISMHPTPLVEKSYSLIITKKSKRSDELLSAFNRGLKKLKAKGLDKHYEKQSKQGAYEKH
ncbi:transporter substrate-binding domain-containing protein [Vibrio sp. T187]|uniref:substrate-binding periplasmic protein n=1 Tax=Vibrio TaxID=662 RepID=UPI0010C97B40|nr:MULTISPECIES: transporter substrate-binding domain-containing protein [Vibrio]MBW3698059.1 transporter substrate-binding domain-containing protein [Vibrio sp. T187]